MKILLLGDGLWAARSLHRLHQDGHQIVGAVGRVNTADETLTIAADELGVTIVRPENCNSPEFIEWVDALSPDLGLSIAYDQIIGQSLRDTPLKGVINFHGGKLPYYRGRNIVNWAIINDEKEIGLTSHYVDEGIDTGDIIMQQTLPIAWTDTYGDVLDKVIAALPEMASQTVRLIDEGQAKPTPQAHLVGTYYGGRQDGDEWIDWNDTSRNIYNKIRAITHPGPAARTTLNDKVILIWRASYDPSWPKYTAIPGQVVGRSDDQGIVVKTGDSTILIQETQTDEAEPHRPDWPIGTRFGIDVMARIKNLEEKISRLEGKADQENGNTTRP